MPNTSFLTDTQVENLISSSITEATTTEVKELFKTKYTITTSITNGNVTAGSAIEIWSDEEAVIEFTPASNYYLPASISVTPADQNYSYTVSYQGGKIVLKNPTQNISIAIECTDTASLGYFIQGGATVYGMFVDPAGTEMDDSFFTMLDAVELTQVSEEGEPYMAVGDLLCTSTSQEGEDPEGESDATGGVYVLQYKDSKMMVAVLDNASDENYSYLKLVYIVPPGGVEAARLFNNNVNGTGYWYEYTLTDNESYESTLEAFYKLEAPMASYFTDPADCRSPIMVSENFMLNDGAIKAILVPLS